MKVAGVELTRRQIDRMELLCRRLRARVITGLEFQREARKISRKLTPAKAYAVCRELLEQVEWYKVLAVLTTTYSEGRERHIEARMLIDIPSSHYGGEFEDFCRWALKNYMEAKGYGALIDHARLYYGLEIVDTYRAPLSQEVDVFFEVWDYDYHRYPFEDEAVLLPMYWQDWKEARRMLLAQIETFSLRGRAATREFYTQSTLGEYEEKVKEIEKKEVKRREGE